MERTDTILYSAGKIARFFGVTKKTVWEWCKTGKLPAFKIGKEWKVRLADLQRMIDGKVRSRREEKGPRLF